MYELDNDSIEEEPEINKPYARGTTLYIDENKELIYSSLRKILNEISEKLDVVSAVQPNPVMNQSEQIYNQLIHLEFIPLEYSGTSYHQPFRISRNTTLLNIFEKGLELWNHEEFSEKYRLYLRGYEKEFNYNDQVNEFFKVNKNSGAKPHFVLAPKGFKIVDEDEESEVETKNEVMLKYKDEGLQQLLFGFCGLKKYTERYYSKLREEESKAGKINSIKPNNFSILKLVQNLVFCSIFALFFIFSFLSIFYLKNPYKAYVEAENIKSLFAPEESERTSFKSKEEQKESIKKNLMVFSYTTLRNKGTNYQMVNMARLSFYQAMLGVCKNYYLEIFKDQVCYDQDKETEEEEEFLYNEYFINTKFAEDKTICDGQSTLAQYFVSALESPNTNFIGDCDNLKTFFLDVFSFFYSDKYNMGSTSIEGAYHTYGSKNRIDALVSLNYVNEGIIDKILYIIDEAKLFETRVQKAFSIDLTVKHIESKIHYYVQILYEYSSVSGRLYPIVKVIPFYPNLKSAKGGKMIYIMDIFRLIFIIILFLITIKKVYDIFVDGDKDTWISEIFSLSIVLDIVIFIIFVILFSLKVNNLYKDESGLRKMSEGSFLKMAAFEYYPIAEKYEEVEKYESVIIILLLVRLLPYVSILIDRTNSYNGYFRLSFYRIFFNYCLLVSLFVFFACFANVLWSDEDENYKLFSVSYLSVFIHSIGHFYHSYSGKVYEVVFFFMFYVTVVFFEVFSLCSLFIESYRINSLRDGNSYSMRIKSILIKKTYHEKLMQEKKMQNETKDITGLELIKH